MTCSLLHADLFASLQKFEYPAVISPPRPAWDGLMIQTGNDLGAPDVHPNAARESSRELLYDADSPDERVTEQCERSFEAGRARGLVEGRAEQDANFAALQQQTQKMLAEIAAGFGRACEQLFASLEPEAARLSLRIAARILRREAQLDPLLLTGAVRAALGQVAAASTIRLLVPRDDLELWTEAMSLLPNLPVKPVVTAGDGMQLGDCRLECELGSVDLSLAAQLGVIERAFSDGELKSDEDAGIPARKNEGDTPS